MLIYKYSVLGRKNNAGYNRYNSYILQSQNISIDTYKCSSINYVNEASLYLIPTLVCTKYKQVIV